MKHILSLVILVCMLLGVTVPALAVQSSDLFATVGESEQTGVMPTSGMEWPTVLVRITAKDEEGAPIAGAVYGVYCDWDNALTAEISTGADGVGVSAPISGGLSYDVKEISLPEGFEKLSVSHPVNPSEGNWQDLYEFSYTYPIKKPEPEKLGRIQLLKCDAADGKPLPGAVFGVYFGEDVKIAELATVSDGTAITPDLPVGDYYLLEQTAPAGYAISTKRHPVLVEEGIVTTVTVENTALPPDPAPSEKPGKLLVTKIAEKSGEKLTGATFGVYEALTDKLVTEIVTEHFGEATEMLPVGEYYLRELKAPSGYVLDTKRVPFRIQSEKLTELTVTNRAVPTEPTPKPDPAPTEKTGRLLVTKVAEKSGEKLPGATFGVYEALTDKLVTEIVTEHFGEATEMLPVGEYYLRELKAPSGYILDTKRVPFRIQSEKLTELTVTNGAVPTEPTPKPDPAPTEKTGRLLVTKVAEKSGEKLTGAVFGVYDALTDKLVTEIVTEHFGEATEMLPVGEYYLRELKAPSGYILDTKRVPFRIQSEKLTELTVTNGAVPTEPTPKPDPVPTEKTGRLLVTKVAEKSGEKLTGAVFGVYDALTDEKVDEVTTDRYGEATFSLPAGEYYLRELKAPNGFIRSTDRLVFKLAAGKQKELTVTNKAAVGDAIPTPPVTMERPTTPTTPGNPGDSGERPTTPPIADNGQLSLVKKAEGSGERLFGAVFGVYNAQTNGKIGTVSTGVDGKAALSLPAGRYYLLEETAPNGYLKETAKILFAVKSGGTTVVEVTNMRDKTAVPEITIPQTGEPFPVGSVLAAAVCFAFAAVLGGALVVRRKRITPAR